MLLLMTVALSLISGAFAGAMIWLILQFVMAFLE